MSAVVIRRIVLLAAFLIAALPVQADLLEEVLDKGVIRVGVADFTPWTMKNSDDELVGSEIDVARKLAADMGIEVEFKLLDWPDLIPAAQNGDIDLISAGMSITPERALRVNFTRPVAQSGVTLTTNTEMTKDFAALAELNSPDVTIAVARDTFSHSVASKLFDKASFKLVSTPHEAGKQVVAGNAHAFVSGTVEARYMALMHGDVVDVPLDEPLVGYPEAMAVRKGEQEMLNYLNAWIESRSSDRWIDTTRDYWFETMEWAAKVKD